MFSATAVLFLVAASGPAQASVPEVVAEYRRLAQREIWPGFEPAATPLLVYDGSDTWLAGHPSPPPGFARVDDRGLWRSSGQHAAARANTSIELAGVPTASFLMQERAGSASELAGVLVHEAFHVFQRARHPDWSANEVDFLLYPAGDGELLFLRRVESEALRRALAEKAEPAARRLAAGACRARGERFAKLAENFRLCERVSELNEGLAQYVQYRAQDARGRELALPAAEYPPEEVRKRVYDVGEAWALLLDRYAPEWTLELEEGEFRYLDERLERALAGTEPQALPEEALAALRAEAAADAARVAEERAERRAAFERAAGWSVEILCARPLAVTSFDPWNARPLDARNVLHTRWVVIGDGADRLEVLDHAALTEGAGEHPFFSGVRRVLITGLPDEPEIEEADGGVTLRASGVDGRWRRARVAGDAQRLTVTVE